MAENLLFATLDPTMRQIRLPGLDKAILSDTVGFVSDLPTQLVAAFRATLEEVTSADLIIHVRDIAHPDSEAQQADVDQVLAEIGVSEDRPLIEAWNKIDLLDETTRSALAEEAARRGGVALLSAATGEGLDDLRAAISETLTARYPVRSVSIAADDGAALAWLHQHGEVLAQEADGERLRLSVRLSDVDWGRFPRA